MKITTHLKESVTLVCEKKDKNRPSQDPIKQGDTTYSPAETDPLCKIERQEQECAKPKIETCRHVRPMMLKLFQILPLVKIKTIIAPHNKKTLLLLDGSTTTSMTESTGLTDHQPSPDVATVKNRATAKVTTDNINATTIIEAAEVTDVALTIVNNKVSTIKVSGYGTFQAESSNGQKPALLEEKASKTIEAEPTSEKKTTTTVAHDSENNAREKSELNSEVNSANITSSDIETDGITVVEIDVVPKEKPTLMDKLETMRNSTVATYISRLGFMVCAYNFNSIGTAKTLMRSKYGTPPPLEEGLLTGASLAGAMIGQMGLGPCADRIGRKKGSLITGTLFALGAISSACAQPNRPDEPDSIYLKLCIERLILGIGAGGDIPILSAITAENSHNKDSSQSIASNIQNMATSITLMQALYATLTPLTSNETAWRSVAQLGALSSVLSVAARALLLKDDSSAIETLKDIKEVKSGVMDPLSGIELSDSESVKDLKAELLKLSDSTSNREDIKSALKTLWKPIVGTSSSWFLYHFVRFALWIHATDILGKPDKPEAAALLTTMITSLSILGSTLAKKLIDPKQLGPQQLQQVGLSAMAASHLMLAIGSLTLWPDQRNEDGSRSIETNTSSAHALFILLYTAQMLADATGPFVTHFLIPTQIFPSKLRSTSVSIAAASGSLGAFMGAASMPMIRDRGGLSSLFLVTGTFSLLSALATSKLIPKYGVNELQQLEETYMRSGAKGVNNLYFSQQT